jgi:hypothetical protein
MCSVVTAVPTLSSMEQDGDGGNTVHVVFKYLSRSLLYKGVVAGDVFVLGKKSLHCGTGWHRCIVVIHEKPD